ncbi:DNA topoisomerase 2, partial [Massospora cicadina]
GLNSKVDNWDTSKLRYEHLMIMMDQDHDGLHIKGLLLNFFNYFYLSLLMMDIYAENDECQLISLTFSKKKADACMDIPSMVDGLKPGQCKIVYGCFLHPDAEIKVATLTGSIIEKVVYHYRDQSLASTIIGLAQNYWLCPELCGGQ